MVVTYRKWTPSDHERLLIRVLAALPEPGQRPAPTPTVRRAFADLDTYERENYVAAALNRLARAGWAEKSRVPGDTRVFWRRTPAGEEGRKHGHLPPAH